MTNQQVRQWYLIQISKIPVLNEAWVLDGISAERRARRAWRIRHDARLRAREMMENPQEVKLLQDRDTKLYGDPDGPTFDYLVEKASNLGLNDDKIYEAIINGSYSTNEEVNKKFDY